MSYAELNTQLSDVCMRISKTIKEENLPAQHVSDILQLFSTIGEYQYAASMTRYFLFLISMAHGDLELSPEIIKRFSGSEDFEIETQILPTGAVRLSATMEDYHPEVGRNGGKVN